MDTPPSNSHQPQDIDIDDPMMMNRSTRGSFSRQISAIGAKISRALGSAEQQQLDDGQSIVTLVHGE